MEINFERAQRFLQRTIEKERTPVKPVSKLSQPVKKLTFSIFTFLSVPSITILVLWVLELAKTSLHMGQNFSVWNNVFECKDFIFLVFSLAFGVILEWLLSTPRVVTPIFTVIEVVVGMVSLILYAIEDVLCAIEDTISRNPIFPSLLESNSLMMNRLYFHLALFLGVGAIAMAGYFQRYRIEKNTKRLRGVR